jgi:Na+-transporting NADH:ubiquinone oxidoreductase subunit C
VAEAHTAAPQAAAPRGDAEPGALRTLLVALAVCAVCSAVVTTSVVLLRPLQLENRERERERQVAALVASLPGFSDLLQSEGVLLTPQVVELATGAYQPALEAQALLDSELDPRAGVPLPAESDLAGIGRRPHHAAVYELRRDGAIDTVILPIYGRGYAAGIRGYLALAGDANTVRGIVFTEHQETPGIGAEIQGAEWRSLWPGKRLRDEAGELRFQVVQEAVPPGTSRATHEVQGISGATRTSEGVSQLVRFWVGPDGFGPYLERIRAEAIP